MEQLEMGLRERKLNLKHKYLYIISNGKILIYNVAMLMLFYIFAECVFFFFFLIFL